MKSMLSVVTRRRAPARRALTSTLLVAAALTLVTTVASAGGDNTVPLAWQGVWDTTTDVRICGNPTVLFHNSGPDTLCAGEPIFDEEGVGLTCSGEIADSAVDWTCTGSVEVEPGCTATYTFTLVGTRTGDTYQAVQTFMVDYSEGCSLEFQDSCLENTSTATRTGADPDCTGVPAALGSWSSVKARFQ